MIATCFDLNTILYKALQPLKASINGDIYKGSQRPENSEKQDITIVTIATEDNMTVQTSVCAINVWVKDLKANIGGTAQYFTDDKELIRITSLIVEQVGNLLGDSYIAHIDNVLIGKEKTINQSYATIRLKIYHHKK